MSDIPPEQSDQPAGKATEVPRPAKASVLRRVVRTSLLLAFLYVALCGLMVWQEPRLVFPGAYMDTSSLIDPNRFDPDELTPGRIDPFVYQVADGTTIRGRMLLRESADDVVLFLHGNGIHADEMDGWTKRLSDAWNASVLTAEYRGFQGDDFTPSEASTIEDAVAAMDALSERTGKPIEDIVIYGRSLGGGVASGLVGDLLRRGDRVNALLLDRTFDSVAEVGAKQFFFLPVRYLIRNRFDSVNALQKFDGAVVQIHGTPDRIVPRDNGRVLFESLSAEHKEWIEVPDMGHNERLPLDVLQQAGKQMRALRSKQRSP